MNKSKLLLVIEAIINDDIELASTSLHEPLIDTMSKILESDTTIEVKDEKGI